MIEFKQEIIWPDDVKIDDAALKRFADEIGRRINAEFMKVVGFAPPSFPSTIEIQPPPRCGCYVIHHGNCRLICT